jgi:hypothetical protein
MAAIGKFSDYRVTTWLNELNSVWLGLAFDNPDIAGAYASEVFGGSYTRQKISMSLASNRGLYNVSSVLFTGLPGTTITHLVGWDAQYNGNYEFAVPLEKALPVVAGASFPIAPEQLVLSFS